MFFLLATIGTALAAPPGAAWTVGIGGVDDMEEAGLVGQLDGARLVIQRGAGAWGIEGWAYGTLVTDRYTDVDLALLETALTSEEDWSIPLVTDQAAAALLADWRLVTWGEDRPRGGPRLYMGAELRRQVVRHLVWDPSDQLSVTSARGRGRAVLGPVLGAGLQLEWARLGGRVAVYDRMSLAPSVPYDPAGASGALVLDHDPTLAVDLLLAL